MPKLNPYYIKENYKKVEEVREIDNKYKVPSYEEFMKGYESDEKINDNYELEVDSYGDIREPKRFGPMFNLLHVFQSLQQVLEYVPRLEHTTRHLPDVTQAAMETGRFVAEHSNELIHVGRAIGEYASSSSSSAITTTASYASNYRTLGDGWANGITGDERQVLLDLGFSDKSSTYSLRELKETVGFSDWAEREWPYTFSEVDSYSDFLEFKRNHFADFQKQNLPGEGDNGVKLKGTQGWKNTSDNTIGNKDKFHGDHGDVTDRKGNKIKEVDFYGRQIGPYGPKNRNKRR